MYDASAKTTTTAWSLNQAIYKGRVLLEDLVGILFRFRSHKISLIADIEKAYLQIGLKPEDRDYVRFLWLKDIAAPLDFNNLRHLRFMHIAFGIIASQFILTAVVLHHITRNPSPFSEKLKQDFYADNLISGCETEEEVMQFFNTAIAIFDRIHEFTSMGYVIGNNSKFHSAS